MHPLSKRIFKHVEVAHVGVFFGFVTLGIALLKDYGFWVCLAVWVVGVVLALSAAHNSYISKSTALTDKYEEIFFRQMNRERKSAALFLLGENSNADELEDVLDFFESPVAKKIADGCMDAEQAYETFYHWIRLYHQASHRFIQEYRVKEPAAYTSIGDLYARTSEYEEKEIEQALGRKCKLADLLLNQEDLAKYLRQEANLKNRPCWEKVFRTGGMHTP
jgi:hypothetical protein